MSNNVPRKGREVEAIDRDLFRKGRLTCLIALTVRGEAVGGVVALGAWRLDVRTLGGQAVRSRGWRQTNLRPHCIAHTLDSVKLIRRAAPVGLFIYTPAPAPFYFPVFSLPLQSPRPENQPTQPSAHNYAFLLCWMKTRQMSELSAASRYELTVVRRKEGRSSDVWKFL